ncbi:NAD-dependent epimerase/dehydratase family protein [Pirellulales bacterium]|nr:NAD-dependent epimerase/dehydratase family protein [Pirellulales bacterium]
MSRVLVTGASGFVGSNLVGALCRAGRDVRCLVRSSSNLEHLESLDAEIFKGSLEDPVGLSESLDGVSEVYHVAGCTTALDQAGFFRVNVDASRRLAKIASQQANPPTFVFVSSLAAGGPATNDRPRTEVDPDQPVSTYGRSKLAAEKAIAEFADRTPISIVRPPIIFGPADRASLNLYRTIRNVRIHPLPGFRSFSVSLVHVADLCAALIRVAQRGQRICRDDRARGTYYVAGDRAVTYPEFGRLAGKAAGWRALPLPLPKAVFWTAGVLGECLGRLRQRPTLINLDKIREATAIGWVCSDQKIRRDVDYCPAAPLEERFRETVEWYRERGWL